MEDQVRISESQVPEGLWERQEGLRQGVWGLRQEVGKAQEKEKGEEEQQMIDFISFDLFVCL